MTERLISFTGTVSKAARFGYGFVVSIDEKEHGKKYAVINHRTEGLPGIPLIVGDTVQGSLTEIGVDAYEVKYLAEVHRDLKQEYKPLSWFDKLIKFLGFERRPPSFFKCTRCGRDEIDAAENGCGRGPCPMDFK